MKITRRSPISGLVNCFEIDVTEEQIQQWQNGTLLQEAMPSLKPWEREFIKTGMTRGDWEEIFE